MTSPVALDSDEQSLEVARAADPALVTPIALSVARLPRRSTELGTFDLVYSFGVGRDVSFDLSMIASHDARVCAFDPTPEARAFVSGSELPPSFEFFPWGLAAHDGEIEFEPQ